MDRTVALPQELTVLGPDFPPAGWHIGPYDAHAMFDWGNPNRGTRRWVELEITLYHDTGVKATFLFTKAPDMTWLTAFLVAAVGAPDGTRVLGVEPPEKW